MINIASIFPLVECKGRSMLHYNSSLLKDKENWYIEDSFSSFHYVFCWGCMQCQTTESYLIRELICLTVLLGLGLTLKQYLDWNWKRYTSLKLYTSLLTKTPVVCQLLCWAVLLHVYHLFINICFVKYFALELAWI